MPAQKAIGKFTVYVGPDGALVLASRNGLCMLFNSDETRGLFDYLLETARYFQAGSERLVDGEPLRRQARMERE